MGKEGVGIPIIMGLALSTRKVPWEVAKPLPSIELPQPNLPTQDRQWFVSLLELNFHHPYLKNNSQNGWRDYGSITERQLARPLCSNFPIGVSTELPARANAKRDVFHDFCKEMSQGQIKLMFKGMH